MNTTQLLESGVKQLGIEIDRSQLQALEKFMQLLHKWNKTYNLTAIENTEETIQKHILDSLTVVPYVRGTHIIDVGSGAGLPGIPLAIFCQDKQFVLLDSNAKKTRFIQQVIIELGLKNTQVRQQRVQEYVSEHGFDTVVSRAFAGGAKLIGACNHLHQHGRVIIMLGKQSQLYNLPEGYTLEDVNAVNIPGLQASRHIALVKKHG